MGCDPIARVACLSTHEALGSISSTVKSRHGKTASITSTLGRWKQKGQKFKVTLMTTQ